MTTSKKKKLQLPDPILECFIRPNPDWQAGREDIHAFERMCGNCGEYRPDGEPCPRCAPSKGPPPEVPVTPRRSGGIWRIVVKCPFCCKQHQHGGGPISGEPILGGRLSHCSPAREYRLVVKKGSQP